jgi:hypothetical protein
MINRILLGMALLLCISCNTNGQPIDKVMTSLEPLDLNENMAIKESDNSEKPYTIALSYDQVDDNTFTLIIDMSLEDDAHYVSPNSKVAYKGRFTMFLKDHSNLELQGDLNETPRTVEEIDSHPFVNGPINWVRENTKYTQQVKINADEDFELLGHIQFTIEPLCTLEKIPIVIAYKNGVFKFEFFEC